LFNFCSLLRLLEEKLVWLNKQDKFLVDTEETLERLRKRTSALSDELQNHVPGFGTTKIIDVSCIQILKIAFYNNLLVFKNS